MYDFSITTDRSKSNAEKYTLREELFGTEDVEPVWVADMDIDTPDFVLHAVKKRLEHPVMGYEEVPLSAYEAQREWMQEQHNFTYEVDDVFYSHSVVASMCVAIEACTQEGDGVIVQTPVYSPFFHSVSKLGREIVKNPLHCSEDGDYSFNIADLKSKINAKTKLLLLCSPHNPVGRVWKKEELLEILALCLEHNIMVFADEIHSDLVYAPNVHTPFATLSDAKRITMTAIGVGKTFNMAGFAMSSVIVSDARLKEKFKIAYDRVHFAQGSVLSHIAFEAAYKEGKTWLSELKIHLYKNFKELETLCLEYSEFLKITPIEGTYLAWLDCSGLALRDKKLREFFIFEIPSRCAIGTYTTKVSCAMRCCFISGSASSVDMLWSLSQSLMISTLTSLID